MKDILHKILESIVTDTEKLSIEETDVEGVVTLTASIAKEDIGKVIGKEGKVIRAIRNVMKIPAMKQQKKITISLLEA